MKHIIQAGLLQLCLFSEVCCPYPCYNGGTCRANANGTAFTCDCPPGFAGADCRDEITVGKNHVRICHSDVTTLE